MTQTRTAIVIVTYNSEQSIGDCLRGAVPVSDEVIVVDNASKDSTREIARRYPVRLIENAANYGFAAAANTGIEVANADFVLLLNPDCILRSSLEPLIEACASPNSGAAGGKLVGTDGLPQIGFNVRRLPSATALACEALGLNHLFPCNPVNWKYRCLDIDLSRAALAEQPAGAFLGFQKCVWREIGGLDEGYFPIWFEDVDFCKRLRDRGYDIWYTPFAIAQHTGGHAIGQISLGLRTQYWYRSLLRYSIRHFRFPGKALTGVSVATGSVLRAVFGGRRHRTGEMVRTYAGVVGLAFRSIWVREVQFGTKLN